MIYDDLLNERRQNANKTYKDFRLAIVNNDLDALASFGTLTWIDDVVATDLIWVESNINFERLQVMLTGIANAIVCQTRTIDNADSFTRATYHKLESLGWKTYQQLVRKVYKTRKSVK